MTSKNTLDPNGAQGNRRPSKVDSRRPSDVDSGRPSNVDDRPGDDFGRARRPTKTWAQLAAANKLRRPTNVNNDSQRSTPKSKKANYTSPSTAAKGEIPAIDEDVDDIADEDIVYVRDPVIEDYDAKFAKDISVIRQYLRDSGLDANYKFMVQFLLTRGVMPANPYPGFVKRTRQYSESFHMRDNIIPLTEIEKTMDYPYVDTGITYIVQSHSYDNIIGLPTIVRCINPFNIQDYERVVLDMLPKVSTFLVEDEYSMQVVGSLIGQAVFHGTFYEEPSLTEVRVEYIVTGPRLDKSVEFFINSVIADLNYMRQFSTHVILGLKVPIPIAEELDIWMYDFWSLEGIQNGETRFKAALSNAILHSKFFSVELVLRDELFLDRFYRARKEYGMNYIRPASGEDAQILSTFSEAPMQTLYQGFFYQRQHVEAFMGLYLPRGSVIDASVKPENQRRHFRKGKDLGKQIRENMGINVLREDRKKVDIDGFLLGDDGDKFGPYGPQVVVPIKSLWQKKVATFHHYSEVFDAAHYVLLLAVMERDAYHDELLVQLYRLLHSSAARLVRLLDKNKVIRELVLNYLEERESSLVDNMFRSYRKQLKDLLNSDLYERSSDVRIMSKRIDERLDKLVETDERGVEHSLPLEPNTVMQLRYLNMYCSCLYAQLVEDAIHESPLVPEYILKMRETFPEISGQVMPKTAERQHRPDKMRTEMEVPHHATFKYGYEYQELADQDRQVIDIEVCVERDHAPTSVATESVLLKYSLDVHLDEVWADYLEELLTGRHLPPNPYPRLVTHFRRAAMKMHLWFEEKNTIVARLRHDGPKLEDPENYVYEIPGCEAHGHISALCLLDTNAYVTVKRMMKAVRNTTFLQRKGPYKIAMTLALSGHSSLYGRVDPYLKSLELHEHCYIKGPDRSETEAITIYSRLVYEHLVAVLRKDRYPLIGFFVGQSKQRWGKEDILTKGQQFIADFERACNNRQPLVMKVCMLVDWQYVPVVKKHLFHYVNADESERILFFDANPVLQYENVFLQREKASFHFQQGATTDGCSPFTPINMRIAFAFIHKRILQEAQRSSWLTVHRWLLTKSLIKQTSDTHIAETWRMLHSVAGELEFVNQLNVTLQELLYYALGEDERRIAQREEIKEKDKIGELSLSSFGIMLQAYRDKLDSVLKKSATMAPVMFADMVQGKLKQVTERDSVTDLTYVIVKPQSLNNLAQVHQMTQALLDIVAEEVHRVSPEALSAVRSIVAENRGRPVTVEPSHTQHRLPKITLLASDDILNEWVI